MSAQAEGVPPVQEVFAPLHVGGKAGGQKRLLQPVGLAGSQAFVAQPGARAFGCLEHLLTQRVEDDARDQLTGDLQADGYTIEREAVDVIGGAVERIDNPGGRRIRRRAVVAGFVFLPQKAVVGEAVMEVVVDRFLRGDVRLGDQVEAALLAHAEAAPPVFQDRGGPAGGLLGGIKIIR